MSSYDHLATRDVLDLLVQLARMDSSGTTRGAQAVRHELQQVRREILTRSFPMTGRPPTGERRGAPHG